MNRFRAWGLSLALAAVAGAPAIAADPADPPVMARQPGQQTTVYDMLFGPRKPKPSATAAAARPAPITAPLAPEVVAAALRAEQAALERRMEVCTKLYQVAVDKNDESLMRRVEELERQATVLYDTRVAALGLPKMKSAVRDYGAATAALDRRLGTGVATTPLTAPTAPTPAVQTAEARVPVSSGDYREVRP